MGLPESIRLALAGQDPDLAREVASTYEAADEETRADILAFFESDGPRRVHEHRLKLDEGIPTGADLVRWLTGESS